MQRRRQRRKKIGAAGVAGILAAAALVAIGIGFGVHKVASHHTTVTRTQTTLLFSLVASDGSSAGSVLLAHDSATHDGVELLLPSRTLSEVCGFGSQQLGRVLALPDGQRLSTQAVSNMLGGVTVDGSWRLTGAELTRLVDIVGGVTVNVDTNVIKTVKNRRVLYLQKGSGEHLTGTQAVLYATYIAGGEDSSGNLPRLQAVLDALLAKLPADPAAAGKLVASVGPDAGSTLGQQRLGALLTGLAADDKSASGGVLPIVLPVQKIDSGGVPVFRVDDDKTHALVLSNLGASLPASARVPRKRILLQNGVGTPGLVGPACQRLVAAGYTIVGSGNANSFDFNQSKVLVFDNSIASAQLGDRVAQTLRLSTDDVAVSNEGQNVADVIVILGKDFRR
ncbi:MAG TPA: LCP family protein [Mycobacteriales bacterium]|jgi:anionic cell wall polymer biosynthesis LytR-Cps2A-Psr (LCP) family protein|nr:LCP family protein [Mycobacteriales bacterium]